MYRLLIFSFLFSCAVSIDNNKRVKFPFKRTQLCISEAKNKDKNKKVLDEDIDYIPDNIEECLGFNPLLQDQDQNNVVDGIDSIYDPFFYKQWHLRSLGIAVNPSGVPTIQGNDLDLMELYHKYMGFNSQNRIVVQVVDDGVDVNHEDLNVNIDIDLSRDSIEEVMGNPSPLSNEDSHGTMCAGIVAATAFNHVGVRGVGPFANIAANNWLKSQTITELEEVWLKNDPEGKIAIASNSWGSDDHRVDQETLLEEYMYIGTETLRKYQGINRGKIFVKAAGNGREYNTNTALHYDDSNPYVFSVAALRYDNKHTSYSTQGSNLLVTAYSGDSFQLAPAIATTTIEGISATTDELTYDGEKRCYTKNNGSYCAQPTWQDDSKRNYTYGMSGTSASTPMVAGVLALVLEACPFLYWRDLKRLTAKHARKVDPNNESWSTNSAGYHHSTDYGFGLINPKDMIESCQSDSFETLPPATTEIESFDNINLVIKDLEEISFQFNIQSTKIIEWTALTIFSDHSYASDLEIDLVSPSGTKTQLVQGRNSGGSYDMKAGHRYGSLAFMGEEAKGTWKVIIRDKVARDEGVLEKIQMKIFGH